MELLPGGPLVLRGPAGWLWEAGNAPATVLSPIRAYGSEVGTLLGSQAAHPTLEEHRAQAGRVDDAEKVSALYPSRGGEQPAEEEEGRLCSAP